MINMGVPGTEVLTTSSAVLTSGKPVRVFSAHWQSSASAGRLLLHNGTANTDQKIIEANGTASLSTSLNFEGGLLFPSGCYFDKHANVLTAAICCVLES